MELVSFDGWKWRPSNSEERERRVKSEGKRDLACACATRHATARGNMPEVEVFNINTR
jgi:hypothetical protein